MGIRECNIQSTKGGGKLTDGTEMIVETLGDDGGHTDDVVLREEGEIRDDGLGIVNESGKMIHVEAPERVRIHRDVGLLLVAWLVVVVRRGSVVRRRLFVRPRVALLRRIRRRGIATAPRGRILPVA